MAPIHVAMMNAMLSETMTTGTGKTVRPRDFRDAWFIGYTAPMVAGVWFGHDSDQAPTRQWWMRCPLSLEWSS